MHRVIILGSGKIGIAIARFLHFSGDYEVLVADKESQNLDRLREELDVQTQVLNVTDKNTLKNVLQTQECVISACPYFINPAIAEAALETGVSYFDLTEDVSTTDIVSEIARQSGENQIFMPQCGLAPGFISILANHLCSDFDRLQDVKMRVGALPRYPSNIMMYNLTWSTDGLINEYCNPCEAIHDGRKVEVMPLEGLEHFSLDGINYESFNTSGGLGTLCETLEGKVRNLNYRTVRYKGHRHLMAFLIRDLRLGKRRELLKDILEHAVPITYQDVVLIFCTVSGWIDGRLVQHSDARKIYSQNIHNQVWSSIQITTAAGICAAVDLFFEGKLPSKGLVKQEMVKFDDFISNRFGTYYNMEPQTSEPPRHMAMIQEDEKEYS